MKIKTIVTARDSCWLTTAPSGGCPINSQFVCNPVALHARQMSQFENKRTSKRVGWVGLKINKRMKFELDDAIMIARANQCC